MLIVAHSIDRYWSVCLGPGKVKMAKQVSTDMKNALARYKQSLEDLTFNSKPLIDDLTRAAGACQPVANQIVELIESRIFKVRPEWKLPSLYLLDSILKNLKAPYLDHVSPIIVGVFCHTFEKLTEPDARKSLYKLRTTWPPYLPNRKLAAIDRHVHALDPNWPVSATDGSISPAIFVNPMFVGESTDTKGSPPPAVRVALDEDQVEHITNIQDKRKKLLLQKKNERQQLGLSTDHQKDDLSGHGNSKPKSQITSSRARSTSPLSSTASSSRRPRSASPTHSLPASDSTSKLDTLPATKRIKVEPDAQETPSSNQPLDHIKQSHLQLDDIPTELLPKHHENILKKVERQIAAGNLTEKERKILVDQLNKLYELQKLKGGQSSSGHATVESTNTSHPAPLSTSNLPIPTYPMQHQYPNLPRPPHFTDRRDQLMPLHRPRVPERSRVWPMQTRNVSDHGSQGKGPDIGELFESLRKAGMLNSEVPPLEDTSGRHKIPNLSLTPATLKQRYGSVIALLHSGEPCASCGLRFLSNISDVYRSHLNWHYKMNRLEKESQNRSSQNWFMHPDDWLKFEELAEEDNRGVTLEQPMESGSPVRLSPADKSEVASGEQLTSCPVQAGEDNEVCTICHEPFEQFWEEEEESWHYRDAMRDPSAKLYHTFCYKDTS